MRNFAPRIEYVKNALLSARKSRLLHQKSRNKVITK